MSPISIMHPQLYPKGAKISRTQVRQSRKQVCCDGRNDRAAGGRWAGTMGQGLVKLFGGRGLGKVKSSSSRNAFLCSPTHDRNQIRLAAKPASFFSDHAPALRSPHLRGHSLAIFCDSRLRAKLQPQHAQRSSP